MRSIVVIAVIGMVVLSGIAIYATSLGAPADMATITQQPTSTAVAGAAVITQKPTTTVTYSVNAKSPPIPNGCSLARTVSNRGLRMEVYLPGSPAKVGDNLCILVVVYNVNATGSAQIRGTTITATDGAGNVINVPGCVVLSGAAIIPVGGQYSCGTSWDTAKPSTPNGPVPQAGTYRLEVSVGSPLTVDANVALSA
jgi:hypothetical protein